MTFQRQPVRSSATFYGHFNLAMGRSPGFGSTTCNSIALFRLAFASAPPRNGLTLLQTVTRRIIMQKARGHTPFPASRDRIVLPQLVSTWFQVLLTPLKGVLFTIQSPYLSTIGRRVVLSLGGWSPRLHAEFHELYATLGHLSQEGYRFRVRGCHLLRPAFPDRSANDAFVTPRGPATPQCMHRGLG